MLTPSCSLRKQRGARMPTRFLSGKRVYRECISASETSFPSPLGPEQKAYMTSVQAERNASWKVHYCNRQFIHSSSPRDGILWLSLQGVVAKQFYRHGAGVRGSFLRSPITKLPIILAGFSLGLLLCLRMFNRS